MKKAVVTVSGMIRAYADTKILIGNNITFVKNQEKKRLLLTVISFFIIIVNHKRKRGLQ